MKVERTDKYIKVTAEEGMYLTRYEEGDDIMNFNGFKIMYAPLNANIDGLHDISEELYNELENKKLELYGKDR